MSAKPQFKQIGIQFEHHKTRQIDECLNCKKLECNGCPEGEKMTYKDTIEYLTRIKRIDAKIKALQLKHEAVLSCLMPSGIRYDVDKIQTSPSDPMSAMIAKAADIEKEIQRFKSLKYLAIISVSEDIHKLSDETEIVVMMGYYIARKPMGELANELNYSMSGIYRVKERAVEHLAKILDT